MTSNIQMENLILAIDKHNWDDSNPYYKIIVKCWSLTDNHELSSSCNPKEIVRIDATNPISQGE